MRKRPVMPRCAVGGCWRRLVHASIRLRRPTGGAAVSLRDARVEPAVPVSDMAQAKDFYESKLGLTDGRSIFDGGITYPCGEGREIHIYPSPANAGSSGGTIAAWEVVDLEKTVDELSSNGVVFERFDSDRLR